MLAALAVGLALAPCRLAAQQPAATESTSQPAATNAQPEAPKSEAPSQEDQDKAFLLNGPIVKWTAKTFHLSVESASWIYQVLNFIVIALLIGVPIIRVLPKLLQKRSHTLSFNLQTAREATADANARLSAVEVKLAGLDEEIKQFRAQIEAESAQDEVRIKAAITEESARIVQSAEQELTAAAAQAQRALRHFAADLAIEQAAKQLDLTPESDRALIAEFIGQASSPASRQAGNGGNS